MFNVCFSSGMTFTNRKRKNKTCNGITDYSSEVNFVDLQIILGTSLTTLCSRNAKIFKLYVFLKTQNPLPKLQIRNGLFRTQI